MLDADENLTTEHTFVECEEDDNFAKCVWCDSLVMCSEVPYVEFPCVPHERVKAC